MYILYLIAMFPLLIGLLLFACFHKKIIWTEWLMSTILAFIVAGIFHSFAIFSMTTDLEIWSGELNKATFYPEWIEEYTEVHTKTNSKGEVVGTYTDTHHRTHSEYWNVESNININFDVEKSHYDDVVQKFGGTIEIEKPYKSGFDSGDPNIYVTHNKTSVVVPIVENVRWKNKIKCAPSVFSFAKVPDNMKVTSIHAEAVHLRNEDSICS